MRFELTDEQRELKTILRKFFQVTAPLSAVREADGAEPGYTSEVWQRMGAELGLPGVMVPEEHGGVGAGLVEAAVVLEEMGRAVVSAPFLSSAVIAGTVIQQTGDTAAAARYLPGIADASLVATLAVTEEAGSWDLSEIDLAAHESDEGYVLNGRKVFVLDGTRADLIIVAARSVRGLTLFAVEEDATGLTRESPTTLDPTRPLARLTFDNTPAALLGGDGDGTEPLRHALMVAAVALGAEQVGGAQRCLEMAAAYASQRIAFDRPIGSFQAIKHKLAEMYIDVEAARAAVYHAAWSVASSASTSAESAAAAKALASRAFVRAAQQNIQIHGGIGFTFEHDAHFYLKRAKASEQLLGAPSYHFEQIARRIGL